MHNENINKTCSKNSEKNILKLRPSQIVRSVSPLTLPLRHITDIPNTSNINHNSENKNVQYYDFCNCNIL